VSATSSLFRVVAEVVGGLLLAGLIAGIAVPVRPDAFGPGAALGLALLCVGAVVWVDWQFFKKP